MASKQELSYTLRDNRWSSELSLGCFSVDSNVLHILWDENIDMDKLLNFSFDRIDKLAADNKKTVTEDEKERLWDYVQRMRREQKYWITFRDMYWDPTESRYVYPKKSRSLRSLRSEPMPNNTGTPAQKSIEVQTTPATPQVRGREVLGEIEPGESLTHSEVWDIGSPCRRNVVVLHLESAKKKRDWRGMFRKVFGQHSKQHAAGHSQVESNGLFAGAGKSSIPCRASPDLKIDGPPLPGISGKKHQKSIGRSLFRVVMSKKKKRARGPDKADKA